MKNINIFNKNNTKHCSSFWGRLGGVVLCLWLSSCGDYLDVVPDNVATIDYAFRSRNQAESYLYGLFSYMPNYASTADNVALIAGDEIWIYNVSQGVFADAWYIAQGRQNGTFPYCNYLDIMYRGLRDCNIFLENIHIPFDIQQDERTRWIAEATFMKAYIHFWLFRMYGPISLIKENLPIDAAKGAALLYREPVDEVADYICDLLDEAVVNLPLSINDEMNELGRPTKAVALALKAQTLTLAASPLFNGNTDYASVKDERNIDLFPQTYSPEKWQRAAQALKEAIEIADEAGHTLYDFRTYNASLLTGLSEQTILSMQVRGAATDKWNREIIWGDSRSNTDLLQRACMTPFDAMQAAGAVLSNYSPTQRVVEQFYTKNGVPIEEDKEWAGTEPMALRRATADDKFYVQEGAFVPNLFLDREARFYGSVLFDMGTLFGNGRNTDNNPWIAHLNPEGNNGSFQRNPATGYLCKKLLNFKSSMPPGVNGFTQERYPFPIIRLADLYLMYAEVLNETKAAPDAEVYEYIDLVRARTGLKGVVESWRDHALDPGKPLSKVGMRDIIQRERLNELAFEGSRFWDLKRWKLAETYFNKPIRGLDVFATGNDFYNIREIFSMKYSTKDYLWPYPLSNLVINVRLVQNYGW